MSDSTDDFERQSAEAKRKIVERHDLEADANDAHELIDEAVALWDDLDHAGRISRLRKASIILNRTLDDNQTRIELKPGDEHRCPDCGSTELELEDIGAGKNREYCTECDYTIGV